MIYITKEAEGGLAWNDLRCSNRMAFKRYTNSKFINITKKMRTGQN